MASPTDGGDRVLIVEFDLRLLAKTASLLEENGFQRVITCRDSREVLGLLEKNQISAVLLDIEMPHLSGEDLLESIRSEHPNVYVIMLADAHEIEPAVSCMQKGAFDFIRKAGEADRIILSLRRALELDAMRRKYEDLRLQLLDRKLNKPEAFAPLVTVDPRMQSIFLFAELIARTDETILILGETGVGKDLMARAIHAASERRGALVAVNAAGLEDSMFADTLFGHRKGAYTGADSLRGGLIQQAESGTLFLDEIGDLSPASQIKLLRLIEQREYYPLGADAPIVTNARFILAAGRPLAEAVRLGTFRKDLYYRLRTYEIRIPPLRERQADIPYLLDHFIDEACCQFQKMRPAFPPSLISLLRTYDFKGNVRELRSMVHYSVSRLSSNQLSLAPFRELMGLDAGHESGCEDGLLQFCERLPTIRNAIDQLVDEALLRSTGNQAIAAGLLGITPQALSKRLLKRRAEDS